MRSDIRLCELTLVSRDQLSKPASDLYAELRFGTDELVDQENTICVLIGLSRAYLNLELEDCRLDSGPRYGDIDRAVEMSKSVSTTTSWQNRTEGSVDNELSASVSAADARVGHGNRKMSARTQSEERTSVSEETSRRISALPGARWRFDAGDEGFLEGKYLDAKHILCTVLYSGGSAELTAVISSSLSRDRFIILEVLYQRKSVWKRARDMLKKQDGNADHLKHEALRILASKFLARDHRRLLLARQQIRITKEHDPEN